jgi:hypothetical protein
VILLSAQRMHTVFDSSGDEFEISPPLAERTAEMVMEKMKNIMTVERQNIDKKLGRLTFAFFMMTITLLVLAYVVYNKPVTIVINVDPAAAGQCPVEDDFKKAPSGQTHVTEHYVFEDMFQHAYVLAMSGMGEEVGNI